MAESKSAKKPYYPEGSGNLVEIEELVGEILVRLPVKCLMRLKATCKKWRSLIESPWLDELYAGRHRHDFLNRLVFSRFTAPDYQSVHPLEIEEATTTTPIFNFVWTPAIVYKTWPLDLALPDPNDDHADDASREIPPYACMMGPLDNGVYCHIDVDRRRRNRTSVATSRVKLENLATKEHKFTNPFPPESAALLSDLARRPSIVGFGFGVVRSESGIVVDYKVVVIVLSSGQEHSRFVSFVYSLRSGTWTLIADAKRGDTQINHESKAVSGLVNAKGEIETPLLFDHYDVVGCPQLFLNGSWHWLDVMYGRVLRFDVAKEAFGYIPGPAHRHEDYDWNGGTKSGLLLMDDRLAIIDLLDGWKLCVGFDVWVMMEYGVGHSWTKVYSSRTAFGRVLDSVVGVYYSTSRAGAEPEATSDTKVANYDTIHIKRILFLDGSNGQFLSWDGSRTTEHGFHLQPEDGLWNTVGVSTYVETLASLTFPYN